MRTTLKLSEIVNEWISTLDCLPASRADYRRKIEIWHRWLSSQGVDPRSPTRTHIVLYKQHLAEQGKSIFTVNGYVTVVKLFYKYCSSQRYYDDIGSGIKSSFRQREHYKHPLTRDQSVDLVAAIDTTNIIGKRDKLMILLMLANGLRTCEVQRANIGDFDMVEGRPVLHIQRKGCIDKHDIVAVSEEVMEAFEDYISCRTDDFGMSSPLFINHVRGGTAERINKGSISTIIKRRLRDIGIDDPKITAHSLRHTCGSLMVEEGVSIETIQDMLGHNNPSTTKIYIDMARQRRLLENSPSDMIARIISNRTKTETD